MAWRRNRTALHSERPPLTLSPGAVSRTGGEMNTDRLDRDGPTVKLPAWMVDIAVEAVVLLVLLFAVAFAVFGFAWFIDTVGRGFPGI